MYHRLFNSHSGKSVCLRRVKVKPGEELRTRTCSYFYTGLLRRVYCVEKDTVIIQIFFRGFKVGPSTTNFFQLSIPVPCKSVEKCDFN